MMVNGLAKMQTPTREATPLLLSMMTHLSDGLALEPANEQLHADILASPVAHLGSLLASLRVRSPENYGTFVTEKQDLVVHTKTSYIFLFQ